MHSTTSLDYNFSRDNEAIEHDLRTRWAVDHELPWKIYRHGEAIASCSDFETACRVAKEKGILGRCTIRDVFAPPPTFPFMIVRDSELEEAAKKIVARLEAIPITWDHEFYTEIRALRELLQTREAQ